jgi:hypothetical protein
VPTQSAEPLLLDQALCATHFLCSSDGEHAQLYLQEEEMLRGYTEFHLEDKTNQMNVGIIMLKFGEIFEINIIPVTLCPPCRTDPGRSVACPTSIGKILLTPMCF